MTQGVNRGHLEKPGVVVYNPETMRLGAINRFSRAFLLLLGVFLIAGCNKKTSPDSSESQAYEDIEKTFDDSEPAAADRKPVEGADLGELSSPDTMRFEKLVDKLPSPCGKAHSLRTSANTDKECIKASFAVDFVVELLKDGASDSDVQQFYEARYGDEAQKRHGFKLDANVPHKGPSDAPVVLVEFFDYGCPSCARFAPVLEETLEQKPTDAAVYYKMFPLASHPNSGPAAQAALAAAKQGKFEEMHDLLFANQQAHTMADLRKYAEQIGLDMQKFEADFQAATAQVAADRKEGDEAGVMGTPTLYVNGYLYQGPEMPKYLAMWIDEQLALGR